MISAGICSYYFPGSARDTINCAVSPVNKPAIEPVTSRIGRYAITLRERITAIAAQIWLCSMIGAMFHNIGQIIAAVAVMRSLSVISYLPILLITGSVAGLFTGLCAQLILNRIRPKGV